MTDLPTSTQPLLLTGNALDVLRQLPEKSVQCVVTSPPYYGLRFYGTTAQVWGGDPSCSHADMVRTLPRRSSEASSANGQSVVQRSNKGSFDIGTQGGEQCGKCGAWRGELGSEPTPELYVRHLVLVARELRRVLRDDGVFWLNLGDSYAGSGGGGGNTGLVPEGVERGGYSQKIQPTGNLKPKDLIGIPWRVAFALQDDGWWLRADLPTIIWDKPNPMTEAVRDRPSRSHEYIFILTKNARYFYDQDAERQDYARLWDETNGGTFSNSRFEGRVGHSRYGDGTPGPYPLPRAGLAPSTLRELEDGYDGEATKEYDGTGAQDPSAVKKRIIDGLRQKAAAGVSGANLKSVWRFPTAPFKGAHFATFPPELPKRCIKLSTSEKGQCAKCGAAWERVVDVSYEKSPVHGDGSQFAGRRTVPSSDDSTVVGFANKSSLDEMPRVRKVVETTGWQPTCECHGRFVTVPAPEPDDPEATETVYQPSIPLDQHPVVPQLVLDPFSGSGTTVAVARKLGRRSIGIDLNPKYADIAATRPDVSTPDLESEW